MKNYKLTLILAFILGLSTSLQAITLDSLGLKKENNKTFLLFKVGPKQSLFSILKRYNLSLTEFKAANSEVEIPVKTGEIVYIPLHYLEESNPAPKMAEEKVADAPKTDAPKEAEIHIVASKQGLLSVANMHKVTMAELRKWNNLTSDRLQEGQRLIISDPSASKSTISVDKTNLLPAKASTTAPAAETAAPATPAKEKGPEDIKKKIAEAHTGKVREEFSEEWKQALKDAQARQPIRTCPHCGIQASKARYNGFHGDKCHSRLNTL